MIKECNSWERILAIIEWLNLTPNSFAMQIGMARAENLYHIQNGNFGISPDMAKRIAHYFPEINYTWLLTGTGYMTCNQVNSAAYNRDSHGLALPAEKYDTVVNYPLATAAESTGSMMLYLKLVSVSEIEVDTEYLVKLLDRVVACRVLSNKDYKLLLSPLGSDDAGNVTLDITEVVQAWKIVAKS